MVYAELSERENGAHIDGRGLSAFAATVLLHIALLLFLLSIWAVPTFFPTERERVQAVAFEQNVARDPPVPTESEPEPIPEVSADAASGSAQADTRSWMPDRLDRIELPDIAPAGLPLPNFELARPTSIPIGGSRSDGIERGGRPGSGGGTGLGDGRGETTGGMGESGGAAARQLSTEWAPSMEFDRLVQFYPRRALAERRAGFALIECTVQPRDRVRECVALGAEPADYGFEEAALRAERIYRVRTVDQDGTAVYGERIVIRARFDPRWIHR